LLALLYIIQTINLRSQEQVRPVQDTDVTFTWCSSANNIPVDMAAELHNYDKITSTDDRNHVMNDGVLSVKEEKVDVLHDVSLSYSNVMCREMFIGSCDVTANELSCISDNCDQQQRVRTDELSNVSNTSNADEGSVNMLTDCNAVTDCDIFRRACEVERVQEVEVAECKYNIDTHDQMTTKSIHLTANTTKKTHECNQCHKTFSYISQLITHKLVHSGIRPYHCQTCNKVFKNKYAVVQHALIHTGLRPHVCDVCNKKFISASELRRHKWKHKLVHSSDDNPFKCNVCDKTFKLKASLTQHAHIHTDGKTHCCDVCDKRFSRASILRAHKRIHTGDKPYRCRVCNKAFTFSANLGQHLRIHATARKTYRCDVCQRSFFCYSTHRKHKLVHSSDDNPFKCNVCDKTFKLKASLTQHAHIHSDGKTHCCDVCHKRFSRASILQAHKRIHTGDKPYRCRVCNKAFTFSANLTEHVRIHSRTVTKKTYQCDTCHRYFSQLRQTNGQENTNVGIKRCRKCTNNFGSSLSSCLTATRADTGLMVYDCDICKRSFDQEGKLTGPKPMNTVNRPSECGLCNRPYICACYLEIHKRTHIDDVPCRCLVCDKVFASYVKFVTHKSQASVC